MTNSGQATSVELWIEPGYEDVVSAGRSIRIKIGYEADAGGVVSELEQFAQAFESEAGLDGYRMIRCDEVHMTLQGQTLELIVGMDVGAQLGGLLPRLGANHIRRIGMPTRSESIVMTDPFDGAAECAGHITDWR